MVEESAYMCANVVLHNVEYLVVDIAQREMYHQVGKVMHLSTDRHFL